jgi:hypothetical protein
MKLIVLALVGAYIAIAAVGMLLGASPQTILAAGPVAVAAFLLGYLVDIAIFVLAVGAIARWRQKRALAPGRPIPARENPERCNRYYGFIR